MLDALSQTVVPPKPALWRRWTALPVFSYYNRLAALVLLSNLAFAVLGVGLQGVSAQTLSSLVLINLSLAILIRQQYLINALFWLATCIPVTWPLRVRRSAAKVYHAAGCTVARPWRPRAGSRGGSVCRPRTICSGRAAFRSLGCGLARRCSACCC